MARPLSSPWPTGAKTVFSDDVASRPTLSKAIREKRIRRLATRVYSADLITPDTEIIMACWSAIVGHLLPGAVLVDRSAAEAGAAANTIAAGGRLFLAATTDRRKIVLPGLEVHIRQANPYSSDLPWTDGLHLSSPARTLVDNLAPSRGRAGAAARTLSRAELEDWLAAKALAWDTTRIERLHREAASLDREVGAGEHHATIDRLFSQLAGTEPAHPEAGSLFRAFVQGVAWDRSRIELFDSAAATLLSPPMELPEHLPARDDLGELPFYEAYFSNYIEGTEFTVAEARAIVDTQQPPADRPEDGHDILGTHLCVADLTGRAVTSTDPTEIMERLVARHRTILAGRPDKCPGEWKIKNNRVGAHEFVDHDLVEGTLAKGLGHVARLPPGIARALYVMLVVSEVHPFADGNGRVARIMANAELSAVGDARIVIPTVFRNEYISGLRRVSTSGDLTAYLKVMAYAWRWTAAMPWPDLGATEGQLRATNALKDSTEAQENGFRLELP